MRVGKRDVTQRFKVRPDGRYLGLVARPARWAATSSGPPRRATPARAVITNHPNGGPIFTGPQLGPTSARQAANDAQCNEPATYSFLYKSSDPHKPGLQPYDPKNPPADVATTTTDQGVEVPFIVRREDGYQDRDRYSILTLFRPGKTWKPWAPQRQWNHKLLVTHGGNCGASYTPGNPPLQDYAGTLPSVPGIEPSYVTALGKGFAVLSTALDNTGHNCNVAMEAESLMMAKERLVETYGDAPLHHRHRLLGRLDRAAHDRQRLPRHLPGPGHHLLLPRHADRRRPVRRLPPAAPLLRGPAALGARRRVDPDPDGRRRGAPHHVNAVAADEGSSRRPSTPSTPAPARRTRSPATAPTRYDSETNPGGVRCSVLDMMVNPLGPRPSQRVDAAGEGRRSRLRRASRWPTTASSTASAPLQQGRSRPPSSST